MNFFESDIFLRIYDLATNARDYYLGMKHRNLITAIAAVLITALIVITVMPGTQERRIDNLRSVMDSSYTHSSFTIEEKITTIDNGVKLTENVSILNGIDERNRDLNHAYGDYIKEMDEDTKKIMSLFADTDIPVKEEVELYLNEKNLYLRHGDKWLHQKYRKYDSSVLLYKLMDIENIIPGPESFDVDGEDLVLSDKQAFIKMLKNRLKDSGLKLDDCRPELTLYYKDGSYNGFEMRIDNLADKNEKVLEIYIKSHINGISDKPAALAIPNEALMQ